MKLLVSKNIWSDNWMVSDPKDNLTIHFNNREEADRAKEVIELWFKDVLEESKYETCDN